MSDIAKGTKAVVLGDAAAIESFSPPPPAEKLPQSDDCAAAFALVHSQEALVEVCDEKLSRLRKQIAESEEEDPELQSQLAAAREERVGLVDELDQRKIVANKISKRELAEHLAEQSAQAQSAYAHELMSASEVLHSMHGGVPAARVRSEVLSLALEANEHDAIFWEVEPWASIGLCDGELKAVQSHIRRLASLGSAREQSAPLPTPGTRPEASLAALSPRSCASALLTSTTLPPPTASSRLYNPPLTPRFVQQQQFLIVPPRTAATGTETAGAGGTAKSVRISSHGLDGTTASLQPTATLTSRPAMHSPKSSPRMSRGSPRSGSLGTSPRTPGRSPGGVKLSPLPGGSPPISRSNLFASTATSAIPTTPGGRVSLAPAGSRAGTAVSGSRGGTALSPGHTMSELSPQFAARFGSGILTADAFEAAAIAYAKERAALPVPRHSQLSRVPKPSLLRRSPGIAATPGIPFEWHNSSGLDNKPFSRAPRLDDPLEPFVYGRKAHAARKAAAAAEKAHNSPAASKAKVAAH